MTIVVECRSHTSPSVQYLRRDVTRRKKSYVCNSSVNCHAIHVLLFLYFSTFNSLSGDVSHATLGLKLFEITHIENVGVPVKRPKTYRQLRVSIPGPAAWLAETATIVPSKDAVQLYCYFWLYMIIISELDFAKPRSLERLLGIG